MSAFDPGGAALYATAHPGHHRQQQPLDRPHHFFKRKIDEYAADLDHPFPLLKMARPSSSPSAAPLADVNDDDNRARPSSVSSPSSSCSSSSFAAASAASYSSQQLHFFVRLMSRRTLVVHALPSDTVQTLIDHIESVTGIPGLEQRLIYRGRQLQADSTFLHAAVENDACLYLTGRLRSTKQPRAWRVVNDLISSICFLDSNSDMDAADLSILIHKKNSVERLVKEFLATTLLDSDGDKDETLAYLRVFTLSGAPSALVKLYLSLISDNRMIAENAIRIFLSSNPDFLPEFIHMQCSPILLQFCKMLGTTVGKEDRLYDACRSALGSLLKASGGSLFSIQLRSAHVLLELHLFTTELVELVETALCSDTMFVPASVLTDLSNFLTAMRGAVQDWKGVDGPIAEDSYDVRNPRYENGVGSLYELYLRLLTKVDQSLRKVEGIMEQKGQGQYESHLLMWSHFLTILTVIKNFSKIFEGGEQSLHSVLFKQRHVLNVLFRCAKRNPKFRWFLKYKDVTNFEARRNLVRMMLPEGKEEDELHEMLIDRSQLLAESFEYIGQADAAALHGGLFMEFKNEEATGPGVLREWFCLLCRAIFNPQNVLFVPCPNDRRRFFPNPASAVDPLHLKYLRFSGRVSALALMHNVQVGIVLDRTFFLQLAGRSVALEDVRDADPALYRSCKQILEMDAMLLDSDALGLTFAREIELLGSKRTVELCPGGKDISVNSRNRDEYVNLLVNNSFVTSISEQVAHFAQGFGDILSNSKYQQFFFQSLDLEDFDQMLGGSNTGISVKEWKAHTEYNGYKAKDHQICWFWKIVEGMSEEQRQVLLFFWTSVKYLPVDGFGSLPSRLYIYRSSDSQECLPTSHTCFYRLCLPAYKSKSIMHDRLQLITQEHVSCSFGNW